jgi:hypothetical protein
MEDEKKLAEMIKSISDSLSGEQREKIKACKSVDDFMKFAGEEGIELPDEMLDTVAGGAIWQAEDGTWMVLDSYHRVVQSGIETREEAQQIAQDNGLTPFECNTV